MNKPHAHIYSAEINKVNRMHFKITYLLAAPEPARGYFSFVAHSMAIHTGDDNNSQQQHALSKVNFVLKTA